MVRLNSRITSNTPAWSVNSVVLRPGKTRLSSCSGSLRIGRHSGHSTTNVRNLADRPQVQVIGVQVTEQDDVVLTLTRLADRAVDFGQRVQFRVGWRPDWCGH